MLQVFRNFFKSKFGVVFTLGFLVLIGFAFASSDVANTAIFGGVTGGDRVAVVGDRRIDTADLATTVANEVERARAQQPTLTMEGFVNDGGVEQVLEQMISRWAMADFAQSIGLRSGTRLVDSEIVQMPAFRGASGEFDQEIFRAALAQQGLNEATVREDLAMGLSARQLMLPALVGARLPASFAQRYAALLAETRKGAIAALPASVYAPTAAPTEAQLRAFYTENRDDFIRPERRVLRYASFGEAALAGTIPAPTLAQISARYQRDIANYRASEQRRFTQLVLPTQAAAQAVVNEVRGGMSLQASAEAKGLATSQIAAITRDSLSSQTSAAVAAAGFAAAQGAVSAPAQGSLGWYVLQVDAITRTPGRSLDAVRGEIAAALTAEARRTALTEATARIEEEFSEGRSLAEVARELKLDLVSTQPLTAAGTIYGTQTPAPAQLARVIALAFEMDEGEPQLAETVPGQEFVIFDVAEITESAAAPLAQIREDVTTAWRIERGMAAAGEAADRVMGRLRAGQSLAAAVAAEERTVPTPQAITMNRTQLTAQGQPAPPLMLLFSMAEGTTKRMEQQSLQAWFVVRLDDIATPDLPANSQPVLAAAQQLNTSVGEEYAQQLVAAIEASLEVETNQAAIDAVIAQLTGRAQ